MDVLNLRRILIQGPSSLDFAAIFTLIIAIFSVMTFLRRREPIILTDIELSQMIGLPSSVGKLPVAVGRLVAARQQLGSGEGGGAAQQPIVEKLAEEAEKKAEGEIRF